jgi:hypothetical protein
MYPRLTIHVKHTTRKSSSWIRYLGVAALAACAKDAPQPVVDTASPAAIAPAVVVESLPPVNASRWDGEAGAAIYVPGSNGIAQVVLPPIVDDSVPNPAAAVLPIGAAPATVDLFAPGVALGSAMLGEFVKSAQPDAVDGCDAWPIVPLRDVAPETSRIWRIALATGIARALPVDSIAALSRGDSTQLVVAINRAAAQLRIDTGSVLRGVPFGISKAYRMKLVGDVDAVLTVVERRVNMEASPRVERTVLILERAPKAKGYSVVWRETQYASEDDLVATDLLTVVLLRGATQPTVFLSQDFGDGTRLEMLQRALDGKWSVRWASAYTGC